jgi:RNA recognition motif-containing protein
MLISQEHKVRSEVLSGALSTGRNGRGTRQGIGHQSKPFQPEKDREFLTLRKAVDVIKAKEKLKHSYYFYEVDGHFQLFKVRLGEIHRARIDEDTVDLIKNKVGAYRFDDIVYWFESQGRIVFERVIVNEAKLVAEVSKGNTYAGEFFCEFFKPYFFQDEKSLSVEEIVKAGKWRAFDEKDVATMIDTICETVLMHVR